MPRQHLAPPAPSTRRKRWLLPPAAVHAAGAAAPHPTAAIAVHAASVSAGASRTGSESMQHQVPGCAASSKRRLHRPSHAHLVAAMHRGRGVQARRAQSRVVVAGDHESHGSVTAGVRMLRVRRGLAAAAAPASVAWSGGQLSCTHARPCLPRSRSTLAAHNPLHPGVPKRRVWGMLSRLSAVSAHLRLFLRSRGCRAEHGGWAGRLNWPARARVQGRARAGPGTALTPQIQAMTLHVGPLLCVGDASGMHACHPAVLQAPPT